MKEINIRDLKEYLRIEDDKYLRYKNHFNFNSINLINNDIIIDRDYRIKFSDNLIIFRNELENLEYFEISIEDFKNIKELSKYIYQEIDKIFN